MGLCLSERSKQKATLNIFSASTPLASSISSWVRSSWASLAWLQKRPLSRGWVMLTVVSQQESVLCLGSLCFSSIHFWLSKAHRPAWPRWGSWGKSPSPVGSKASCFRVRVASTPWRFLSPPHGGQGWVLSLCLPNICRYPLAVFHSTSLKARIWMPNIPKDTVVVQIFCKILRFVHQWAASWRTLSYNMMCWDALTSDSHDLCPISPVPYSEM